MSDTYRYAFILNPVSGNGRAAELIPSIEKAMKDHSHTVMQTLQAGDGERLSKEALNEGFDVIVAIGGDGTINEVSRSLVNTSARLGIIPMGSGNGLARHLGIPMNSTAALNLLTGGAERKIDAARLNGHFFFNVAGIGFDAEVSKEFAHSKKRGFISYILITIGLFKKIREFDVELLINGERLRRKVSALSVANSSQYGNNARIAPHADISDGKLDVCSIGKMNLFSSASFLFKLLTGKLKTPSKHYRCDQVAELEVSCHEKWAHLDGDPLEINGSIKFDLVPRSLSVICPS